MRVLLVSGSYPPLKCGVGDYAACLAGALSELPAVTVAVLTSGTSEESPEFLGKVAVWRSIGNWGLGNWRTAARLIRRIQPDIVHIQYPTQGYEMGWLPSVLPLVSALLGATVVQTWHEGVSVRRLSDLFFKALVPGGLVVVRPDYRQSLPPLLRWAVWNKSMRLIRNASIIPRARLSESERAKLRMHFLKGQQRLVVFFGFVLPHKGAEMLFDIADPETDHIVVAGELIDSEAESKIRLRESAEPWVGRSTVTGFLPLDQIAALLAVADAVVLPFRTGGGEWNSSIHAAMMQGTFVLTTSGTSNGYQNEGNVYYARVDDLPEMRTALRSHAGTMSLHSLAPGGWDEIAREHELLYRSLRAS